jgi:hypothetical protein
VSAEDRGKATLIMFLSPELRCLEGIKQILAQDTVGHIVAFHFLDYEQSQPPDNPPVDREAVRAYHMNRATLARLASENDIRIDELRTSLYYLRAFQNALEKLKPLSSAILDISCAPRGHLLTLLRELAKFQRTRECHVRLLYAIAARMATSEDAYSSGVQDIVVVPGLNGKMRSRQDMLVLIAGFEGNRALSVYRRLMPQRTIILLGDSEDSDRDCFLQQAHRNNHSLLHIHGNRHATLPSRDPFGCAATLDRLLLDIETTERDRFNVYLSCLGTKAQTVGAFLALLKHPHVQVLHSLPTRRRLPSQGPCRLVWWDLGTFGLLKPGEADKQ